MSVSPELLSSERGDVDYYLPHFIKNETLLAQCGVRLEALDQLRDRQRPITDGIRQHTKTATGVVLIRTQNLDEIGLSLDDCVYVDQKQHRVAAKSTVRAGDLLIAVRGYLGKVAIVPDDTPEANINQHIARVTVDPGKADSRYLWAFFASCIGVTHLGRQVTGTVQEGIMLPFLRRLPVPLPPRPVQEYIGAKVRLAERCRLRAREGLAEARARLSVVLSDQSFSPSSDGFSFAQTGRLTERLAAEFYLPAYLDLENHLRRLPLPTAMIGDLLRRKVLRATTPDRVSLPQIPCILTSDIEPQAIRRAQPSLWIDSETYDIHPGKLVPFDVVYTSVGPPVGEAAVVIPDYLPMATGSDVSVLRCSKALEPGYLCLYLNSRFGQMQNERFARGIRQRRVYPEDIEQFLIPIADTEDQCYIGQRVVAYQQLGEIAQRLILEAKADVEAMIEGRLDVDGILSGRIQPPTWAAIADAAGDGGAATLP
jgi:type I restriction enzyme S subunit